jgi:hypothetical protein
MRPGWKEVGYGFSVWEHGIFVLTVRDMGGSFTWRVFVKPHAESSEYGIRSGTAADESSAQLAAEQALRRVCDEPLAALRPPPCFACGLLGCEDPFHATHHRNPVTT